MLTAILIGVGAVVIGGGVWIGYLRHQAHKGGHG
jgi:hypothetical protein